MNQLDSDPFEKNKNISNKKRKLYRYSKKALNLKNNNNKNTK